MGDAYADRVRLETRRCSIRPFVPEDRERLAEVANDRRISRNLTDAFPYPYALADADAWSKRPADLTPPCSSPWKEETGCDLMA